MSKYVAPSRWNTIKQNTNHVVWMKTPIGEETHFGGNMIKWGTNEEGEEVLIVRGIGRQQIITLKEDITRIYKITHNA